VGLGYRWHSLRRRLTAQVGESLLVRQLVAAAALYFAVWGLVQVNLPFTNSVVRLVHWSVAEYRPKVNWEKLRTYSQEGWRLPAMPTFKGTGEETAPAAALNGYVFPTEGGKVVSRYGWRLHPVYGDKRFHQGIDIAAPSGTPVKAIYGGYVSRVAEDELLGQVVEINHGTGITSLYGHLGEILVKEKQVVRTGEVIAKVGASGVTAGPHLHLEIKERGVNVDPAIKLGVVEEPAAPAPAPVHDAPTSDPEDKASPGPTVRQTPGTPKGAGG
jgi:murein DD-endopeptidase MepM/ murein hydrolase activator NlpD